MLHLFILVIPLGYKYKAILQGLKEALISEVITNITVWIFFLDIQWI